MAIASQKSKVPFYFVQNNEGLNTQSTRFGRSENQSLISDNVFFSKKGGFTSRKGQLDTGIPCLNSPEIIFGIEFSRTVSSVTTVKRIVFTADGKVYDYTTDPLTPIVTGLTVGAFPDVTVTRGWLCVVNGVDTPFKYNGTDIFQWGISAPTVGPTVAAGAAGNPNGTYRFAVAFRRDPIDSLDPGSVSSVGEPSLPITVTNDAIDLTNLEVSADPQVDMKDIMVEIAGLWYVFDTIPNATTVATYDLLDSEAVLGERGRTDRDPPPATLKYVETHKDIVFAADDQILQWSIIDEFESFSVLYRISNAFNAGDGALITGLRSANNLVVAKERSLWVRSGDDVTYSITQVDYDTGVIARNSMVVINNILYFLAHDGFRYFDGQKSELISGNIQNLLLGTTAEKLVYSDDLNLVSGISYSNNNTDVIIWAVPTSPGNSVRAFSYSTDFITKDSLSKKVGSWTTLSNLNARFIFKGLDSSGLFDTMYTCSNNGIVTQLDTGFTDNGDPINCTYLPADYYFKSPVAKKRLRDAFFVVSLPEGAPTTVAQVEWYVNGVATGIVRTLNFLVAGAEFDVDLFDESRFATEGDFVAVTGYTDDPFTMITPKITWSVEEESDNILWNGWMLRIIPAGIRRPRAA